MKSIPISLALLLATILLDQTLAAQCVRMPLNTDALRGRVYTTWGTAKKEEPFPNASVQLLRETNEGRKIIVDLKTDSSGLFSAKDIPAGRYFLEVSESNFDRIVTAIRIKGTFSSKSKNFLLIELAPARSSTDSCGGEARVTIQ